MKRLILGFYFSKLPLILNEFIIRIVIVISDGKERLSWS